MSGVSRPGSELPLGPGLGPDRVSGGLGGERRDDDAGAGDQGLGGQLVVQVLQVLPLPAQGQDLPGLVELPHVQRVLDAVSVLAHIVCEPKIQDGLKISSNLIWTFLSPTK